MTFEKRFLKAQEQNFKKWLLEKNYDQIRKALTFFEQHLEELSIDRKKLATGYILLSKDTSVVAN